MADVARTGEKKNQKNRKCRQMKKINNCEISEDFSGFWLHTQNPRRCPGFVVVVEKSFDENIDEVHRFETEMCLFPEENQQTN